MAGLGRTRLAKSVHDAGWATFVRLLEEKAAQHGRRVVKIGRWEPTSQICSACGHRDGPKPLGIRAWACQACGVVHDRDVNAARNILVAAGLAETQNACGGSVSPGQPLADASEAGTRRGAVSGAAGTPPPPPRRRAPPPGFPLRWGGGSRPGSPSHPAPPWPAAGGGALVPARGVARVVASPRSAAVPLPPPDTFGSGRVPFPLFGGLAALSAGVLAWELASLRVCPRCGYENSAMAACAGCGYDVRERPRFACSEGHRVAFEPGMCDCGRRLLALRSVPVARHAHARGLARPRVLPPGPGRGRAGLEP